MEATETQPTEAKPEEQMFIDGGQVLILVGDPSTGKAMPLPLPAVFEQLFGVIGHMDERIQALEAALAEPKEKSRIITV